MPQVSIHNKQLDEVEIYTDSVVVILNSTAFFLC